MKSSPAYQWYPKDALSDERFTLMTYEEQGVYRALLDRQWIEGDIPADLDELARILKMPKRRLKAVWVRVSRCFKESGAGRLQNGRLERQRTDTKDFREDKSRGGRASAEARRLRHGTAQPQRKDRTGSEQTPEQDAEQTFDLAPNTTATGPEPPISDLQTPVSDLQSETPRARAGCGHRGRVYCGECSRTGRFYVPKFLHDEFTALLGEGAATFDLLQWYLDVDERAAKDGQPVLDMFAWWRRQLREELTRQGVDDRPATARELADAKTIRRAYVGCPHDPKCATYEDCLLQFVHASRHRLAAAGAAS